MTMTVIDDTRANALMGELDAADESVAGEIASVAIRTADPTAVVALALNWLEGHQHVDPQRLDDMLELLRAGRAVDAKLGLRLTRGEDPKA